MNQPPHKEYDSNGYPILLAVQAAGQVAAQTTSGASVNRGARSGNANADPASGRFAAGSKQKKPGESVVDVNPLVVNRLGIPQGVTPDEWERRLDVIRDAAREFEQFDQGDAKEFLNGRVNDLSAVDVDAFVAEVREQSIDDLIDILDHQLRSKVDGSGRARRFVRVQAPRGYVKKIFGSLTDDEVIKVVTRLSNKGWGVDDLVEQVIGRVVKKERKESLIERFRGGLTPTVKLADWQRFRPDFGETEDYEFDEEASSEMHIALPELPKIPTTVEMMDSFRGLLVDMPAPVINVTVEAAKAVNKRVIRDAEGNLAGIEVEDAEA